MGICGGLVGEGEGGKKEGSIVWGKVVVAVVVCFSYSSSSRAKLHVVLWSGKGGI